MIMNGGFETGNFSGWTTIGDATIQTAGFGTQPKSGDHQALLTTFHKIYNGQEPWEPALPLSGTDPVPRGELETFVDVPKDFLTYLSRQRDPSGGGAVPTDGSAIKQSFHATAGSVLVFYYNFLTDGGWGNANDFAFVTLVSEGSLFAAIIAGVESPSQSSTSGTVLKHETGYRKYACTLPFTGNYTLGLGVIEMLDTWTGSALAVDGVQLLRRPWIFPAQLRTNQRDSLPKGPLEDRHIHRHESPVISAH